MIEEDLCDKEICPWLIWDGTLLALEMLGWGWLGGISIGAAVEWL